MYRKPVLFILALTFTSVFILLSMLPSAEASPTWEQKANKVVEVSKENLTRNNPNKQYERGKAGPDKFDCSGLTQYVFKTAISYSLPRSSQDQANQGKNVTRQNIRKGDLLFFKTSGNDISHVGIYIGSNKMIHAANPEKDIHTVNINDSYWQETFVKAKRVIH